MSRGALVAAVLALATGSLAENPKSGGIADSAHPAGTTSENVIVLPKLIVRGEGSEKFNEKHLFDAPNFNALLTKRFPGMTMPGQPRGLDNCGLLAYSEEKRWEAKAHFEDLASAVRATGGLADRREMQEEINRAFLRRPSWREAAMDRTIDLHRR